MFLKFWIISTVVCILLFYSVCELIDLDVKKEFTKEELKLIKQNKPPRKYAWYIYVFLFVCPILNIIFVLCAGFNYGELRDETMREFRKRCGKQTALERALESIDKAIKNM